MTICIAAIANKDKVVAVTDRMLTLEDPVKTAFEITENNKVIELNDSVIALFSGDVIHANEILNRAKFKIDEATTPPTTTKEIAEIVNTAFTNHWESIVNNFLYRKFKITFEQFMHNQGSFDVDLVKQINQFITQIQLNVEIIVAGRHDSEKEAHVFVMDSLGTVISLDSTGYGTIGSGSKHATFSLIESQLNRSNTISQSLYALLKAKTRAEYDPGVGKLCDILIVDGEIKRFSNEDTKDILKIFNKAVTKHRILDRKTEKEISKKI